MLFKWKLPASSWKRTAFLFQELFWARGSTVMQAASVFFMTNMQPSTFTISESLKKGLFMTSTLAPGKIPMERILREKSFDAVIRMTMATIFFCRFFSDI